MHVSVTPCLTEVIVRGKILLVRVLENQQTSLAQQSVRKNKVDYLLRTFEIVRSIRKNYIELLAAALQIEKDIRLDGIEILESERSAVCRIKLWCTAFISTDVTLRASREQIRS